MRKHLVIDTDIGTDMDDTWALCWVLSRDDCDVGMINVSHGNTPQKAALVAKILSRAGREDIVISVGEKTDDEPIKQLAWLEGFDISAYEGQIVDDGLQVLGAYVRQHKPIILGLSPVMSLAKLDLEGIEVVQMAGSVFKGYDGLDAPVVEWNIVKDVDAFWELSQQATDLTLVPLDCCGCFAFEPSDMAELRDSGHWAADVILENYELWDSRRSRFDEGYSSTLFDVVAAGVALDPELILNDTKVEADRKGYLKPCADGHSAVLEYDLMQLKRNFLETMRGRVR